MDKVQLSNAIKYRRSTCPPRIHVGFESRKSESLFCVKDNGIGFDPQNAERIFTPFQRLHSQQEYAGTGIGLAICKKIIEAHGGRIWAESAPGQGATFRFTLPDRA
jgi:two-component system, chemotaxis family, sensor kinase Cph1